MTARVVAQILFRHQRKMLVCLLAALAVGGVAAGMAEPRYRAEATVLAGSGDAQALASLFESRDLHNRLLDDLGEMLYPALPPESRLEALKADLAVRPASNGSPLVRLALDGGDPQDAAKALAVLVAQVREHNEQVFGMVDPALAENGLIEAERARTELAAMRKRLSVFDVAAERENLLARRGQIQAQAAAAEAEVQTLGDAMTMLKTRLASTPPTIELSSESERSRVVEEARAKLFELETREQELLGKYQETSVFVQRLRDQTTNARALLAQLMETSDTKVTKGANRVHQQLETDLVRTEAQWATAKSRMAALARQLEDVDSRLVLLAENAREMAELERRSAEADRMLAGPRQGRSAIDGIGIVQSAAARTQAIGPGKLGIIGLSALAGLVLALIAASVAQRLSDRFTTPAEIERRLGLKVLTSIPRES